MGDESALFSDFVVVGLAQRGPKLTPALIHSWRSARGGAPSPATSAACEFCFADADAEVASSGQSETFTFTLTDDAGGRIFGFCRRLALHAAAHAFFATYDAGGGTPGGCRSDLPVCLCVLSRRPWFSLFMHLLDLLQLHCASRQSFTKDLFDAAAEAIIPDEPGAPLTLTLSSDSAPFADAEAAPARVRLHTPADERPTGVDFEPLLASLGANNVIAVLGALMLERRIIFVGSNCGVVSSCAHAALALLYPLEWQHIFVPVLPQTMLTYASAPMPFVLGVLAKHLPQLEKEPIGDVLVVNVDSGKLSGTADVSREIPRPLRSALNTALSRELRKSRVKRLDGSAVADAAMAMMVSAQRTRRDSLPRIFARLIRLDDPPRDVEIAEIIRRGMQPSRTGWPFRPLS